MTQSNSLPIARNVCIVCPLLKDPYRGVWYAGLINLIAVLAPLAEKVFIIIGNFFESIPYDNVRVINVKALMMKSSSRNLFARAFQYFSTQFALSGALIRLWSRKTRNIDAVFIFTGEASLITTVVSKLLGKETILILRGSMLKEEQVRKVLFSGHRRLLRRLNLALSDRIITYSKGVITQWKLEKYRNKVLVAPYLFIDFDKFDVEKPLSERDSVVGYIGRLSPEKGIANFVEAVPEIVKASPDVRFLMVGDGKLQDKIERYVKQSNLNDKVRLAGRVSRDKVPGYLNQLKLLAIPSYSEGLPKVMLEAMACGTPVLATPVGSIPDVIIDGKTGFIMEDNSPECIAKNVIRALTHPKLEEIARNARSLVEKGFSYQAAVERFRDILVSLNLKK